MNIETIATKYQVSPATVRSWIRKGLPFIKQGGRGVSWELDEKAVDEWYRTEVIFDWDYIKWDLSGLAEDVAKFEKEKRY